LGALTVTPRASKIQPQKEAKPKTSDQSIALTYLKSGALAFIGCTGTHYSPGKQPYNYYGQPLHDLFWSNIKAGQAPALALFNARKKYSVGIPHRLADAYSVAIELKIFRQFCCLGLGW